MWYGPNFHWRPRWLLNLIVQREKGLMGWVGLLAGIALLVFFLGNLVVGYFQPSAVEVARSYCTDRGLGGAELPLLGFSEYWRPWGRQATVAFRLPESRPHQQLIVELR